MHDGCFVLFSVILENVCTSVIRSNRRRSQFMHVGVRKYRQATDSTNKARPATPDHQREYHPDQNEYM